MQRALRQVFSMTSRDWLEWQLIRLGKPRWLVLLVLAEAFGKTKG